MILVRETVLTYSGGYRRPQERQHDIIPPAKIVYYDPMVSRITFTLIRISAIVQIFWITFLKVFFKKKNQQTTAYYFVIVFLTCVCV